MSLNHHLLSTFASGLRCNQEVNQSKLRKRALAIIYINLFLLPATLVIILTMRYLVPEIDTNSFVITYLFLTVVTLLTLRKGNLHAATLLFLFSLHVANFFCGFFCNLPLSASLIQFTTLIIGFLITSCRKIQITNSIVAFCQILNHLYRTSIIFSVTFTQEQSTQLYVFYMVIIKLFLEISIAFFLESSNTIETHEDINKLNKLTNEVVQVVEAKDIFLNSISHEVRNPLNSIVGSIDYLLNSGLSDNPTVQSMLKHAKISGDALLAILNNSLDAAKIKSDKMDIMYVETEVENVISRAMNISSKNMADKKIKANVIIHDQVPETLKLDGSRLLQILNNLLSNATKFTPEGGEIRVNVNWYDNISTPKEEMLKPLSLNSKLGSPQGFELHSEENHSFSPDTDEFYYEESVSNRLQKSKSFLPPKAHTFENLKMPVRLMPQNNNSAKRLNSDSPISKKSKTIKNASHPDTAGYLKIQVTDTGYGISSDDIPKLFQMFSQTATGARSVYGGTGLGLWISKQLCLRMGGDIAIYSKLGEGTTFVFYIPVNVQQKWRKEGSKGAQSN